MIRWEAVVVQIPNIKFVLRYKTTMEKLKEILIHFAGSEMSKTQMRQIKGGYGEGDSCTVDCPNSSTQNSYTCNCTAGERCWFRDNEACGCGMLPMQGCDA